MFDEYLRERAQRTGEPFVPFDPGRGLRRVRRRQAARRRHPVVPRLPRHRAARGRRRRPARRGDRPRARQPQERARAAADPRPTAWRPTRARSAYVRAARDAGLRRAVVSSSANCRDVLVAAGIEDLFEARIDGVVAEREHLRGQARAGHVPGRAPARSGWSRPRRRCSRTRWPGWRRAGRRVRLRGRGGPGRAGRGADGARRGRRRDRPRRAAGPPMIRQDVVHRRAVVPARDQPRPGPAGPDRVGVRAVQRAHGLAGQPGRGRAARPAGHLPQRGLRAAAAAATPRPATAPRVRADGHQRHQRQADPAARRRRAVRRPLRRAARARARAGLPRRHC